MLSGLGIGLTTAPVTTAALDFAPEDEAGVRAGVLNTSRMIGLSVGIALMGAILTARWPGGLAGAATDPQAFVDGLSAAFLVNTVIALVGAAIAALTIAGGRAANEPQPSGEGPTETDRRRTAADGPAAAVAAAKTS
jgi:MFS family permease